MQRLSKELDVTWLAVWVVAVLLERPLVEQFETEGTGEVLRVPFLAHGRDGLAGDGFLAAGAEGAAGGVVVDLAVRLTLVVVVVPTGERHPTDLERNGGGGRGGGEEGREGRRGRERGGRRERGEGWRGDRGKGEREAREGEKRERERDGEWGEGGREGSRRKGRVGGRERRNEVNTCVSCCLNHTCRKHPKYVH